MSAADRCEIAKAPCTEHVACEVRLVIHDRPQVWRRACYRHADALFAAVAEAEAEHGFPGFYTVECRPDPIMGASARGMQDER